MRNGFKILAEGSGQREYGMTPGHGFHEVEISIAKRGKMYRVHITEEWGSSYQGGNRGEDITGARSVVARDGSWHDALDLAVDRAAMAPAMECGLRYPTEAGPMHAQYLADARAQISAEMTVAEVTA